jgi:hypothetical protein
MCGAIADVRFGPKADIRGAKEKPPRSGLSEFVRPFGGAKRIP